MESTAVSNLYAVYNHAPPPPEKKITIKKHIMSCEGSMKINYFYMSSNLPRIQKTDKDHIPILYRLHKDKN